MGQHKCWVKTGEGFFSWEKQKNKNKNKTCLSSSRRVGRMRSLPFFPLHYHWNIREWAASTQGLKTWALHDSTLPSWVLKIKQNDVEVVRTVEIFPSHPPAWSTHSERLSMLTEEDLQHSTWLARITQMSPDDLPKEFPKVISELRIKSQCSKYKSRIFPSTQQHLYVFLEVGCDETPQKSADEKKRRLGRWRSRYTPSFQSKQLCFYQF